MTGQEIKSLAKKMAEAEIEAKATIESIQKKEKRRKTVNTISYVVGSVALFAVACVTLPSILSNVSGTLYKSSLKRANHDDDDWGPVIERKEASAEPEQLEKAELQEEDDADGD
mgnify:FL=1|jgi:hypothetical protein|nr:hypothetical protein [Bacteroides intestinalis]